jgi:hypothetical protein
MIALLPAFNFLVVSPSFDNFLAASTNDAAVRVARHFVSMFDLKKTVLSIDTIRFEEAADINKLKSDFKLAKFKLISNSGEVLFSSDPEDIGNYNTEKYFHEIVAKGNVVTAGIEKKSASLEGELLQVDVVETYVPIMRGDHFLGAFEIYYDITDGKQQLDKLSTRFSFLVIVLALGFLIASMVILFIEKKVTYKRKCVEKERQKLITDLQDSIAKVKILKGLLPICSNCKKIRDNTGSWDQIESYISEHTEAQLTHSICPECVKKLYPDF